MKTVEQYLKSKGYDPNEEVMKPNTGGVTTKLKYIVAGFHRQKMERIALSKFRLKGQEYPKIVEKNEGYECFITIIPEPTGDYFLAKIDSSGDYQLLDYVSQQEVVVLVKEK